MPTRKALKSADAKLKLVEDKVGIGTWSWDLDTGELVWSPGLCRILGVDPHTVVPTIDLYQSLCHPDDQLDFDDAVGIVSSKKLESRRFRVIRPDGVLRHLHSRAQPHLDRNGRTIMLTGVICDVTEAEEARADLHLQKETVKAVSKHLEGGIWRAHPNGKLVETSHWMKLTGQTPKEAHDWEKLDAIHPEDRDPFREAWRVAIAGRVAFDAEYRIRLIGGTYQRRHGRAFPIFDAAGDLLLWIGHSRVVPESSSKKQEKRLLNSGQIRASRALLDWTGPQLAEKSSVSFSTIRRMEQNAAAVREESLIRVIATFEAAGITYTFDGGGVLSMSFRDTLGCNVVASSGVSVETLPSA